MCMIGGVVPRLFDVGKISIIWVIGGGLGCYIIGRV